MLKEFDTIFSPIMTFDTPRVYNILTDPGERVTLSRCPASAPMRQIGHIEQGRISGSS